MRRAVDVLLYVAIAIAGFALLDVWARYQVKTHQAPGVPLKWSGFAGMTALVFGTAFRAGRRSWSPRFFVLLGVLLVVHSTLGAWLLWRVDRMPLVAFVLAVPVEYVALAACVGFFLDKGKGTN